MGYATMTLSANGQITLPKAIREKMNLKPGDKIEYSLTAENQLQLSRLSSLEEFLDELHASFTPAQKAAIKKNAGKTVRELMEENWNSPENIASRKRSYEY